MKRELDYAVVVFRVDLRIDLIGAKKGISKFFMPKLKTKKAVAKRFKITATGKVMFRPSGQNHFNAKDTGKTTRLKRRWFELTGAEAKAIKKLLPYS